MNRYGAGGPSKATSTTLCQKCLKRGHFSYECKASQQDRPYISRPSRTQQLANPKLAAKITNAAPKDEPPKTSASDIIKSSAAARGRKQNYDDVDSPHQRSSSVSSHSSADSIATISTNQSRSRSPPPRRDNASRSHRGAADRRRSRSRSRDHVNRDRSSLKPRGGGREDPYREGSRPGSHRSRSPPRRHSRRSPSQERHQRREPRRERSRSRSPYRHSSVAHDRAAAAPPPPRRDPSPSVQRERSLSPFSKRQALTRAQYGGP